MASVYQLNLDLHTTQSNYALPITAEDTDRELWVSFSDGGRPVSLEGVTAIMTINWTPPEMSEGDPFGQSDKLEIKDGSYAVVSLDKFQCNYPGEYLCEIDLAKGGKNVASPKFTLLAAHRLKSYGGNVPDSVTNNFLTLISDTNTAKDAATSAAGLANGAADYANDAGDKANTAADEAKTAKEEIERAAAEGRFDGEKGEDGADGKNAYEYARDGGYQGTEEEFAAKLASGYPVLSVNGHYGNVKLDAEDVGARPDTWTPTASEVGARPDDWMPTAADVGARPATWMPSYSDVGAEKAGNVATHNTNAAAHNDIRLLIASLSERINAVLDSDDTTLDELSEIVAVIKANTTIIEAITTGKVNVTDIIDNLTTNVKDKPLSAAQGVALKALIDALTTGKLDATELSNAINTALAQAKASGEFDGADGKTPYIQNGYWYIDGVNTNVKAEGKDGVNGETPLKGKDYWTPTDKKEIISEVNDNIAETLENLKTLPYGGSKEWLEANGDITQLYQIDGYVWGYIESDGWTRSNTQFLVVSSESQMTNAGGTEYLLRSGNTGTVYSYTEASGDVDIPVYDSKPETANEGDIIAVGGRKYRASLTSKQVPNFTDLAHTFEPNRLNSSGVIVTDTSKPTARACADYIGLIKKGDVIRINGIDLTTLNVAIYSSSKAILSSSKLANGSYYTNVSVTTTGAEFTVNYGYDAYFRFSGYPVGSTDDIICTINEPIEYKTVTTVVWTDIGEYNPPVEAGWSATEETYSVIDSLSATANSDDSAVYSGDGYVYAYIAGADWMQMSKYTPQTVDKQLSDTSANAVQNKVVTAAINEVKETANTNAEKIIDLQNKVEGLNGSTSSEAVTIPSYWETEVTDKTALVKELQTAGGKDCVSFAWASDTHIPDNDRGSGDTANTGGRTNDIGKVMAKMLDNCEIPFALITGDINTRASCSTEEKLVETQASIPEHLAPLWGTDRLLIALGNHDGAYGDSSGYYKKQFSPERMWQIFFRGQALDFRRVFSEDGLYYYVDNIPQKTRFIVLNSHFAGEYRVDNNGFAVNNRFATSCYGQAQLDWLANVALDMPEGYSAIITAHAPLNIGYTVDAEQVIGIINAYCNKTAFSGSYTAGVNGWSNSTINVDFTNAKGDIIAFFAGHVHWDKVDTTTMARPIITIIAAGAPVNTHQMVEGEIASTRTFGTATETSFDVVTINKATRKIYCVRVGGAADRFENSTRVIDY